jgi:uncharacterized RDD family membrane protein YckC
LRRPARSMSFVERDLDVRTAEAVAVRFELAGLGSRFLALAADLALQLLVVLAVFVVLMLYTVIVVNHSVLGGAAPGSTAKLGSALGIALAAIASFVLFFGYFIVFELAWNGQSPGKRLLGLRVIRDGGFPVDAGASVIRNLVRIVEASLGFYVISAVVTLLSPENKRLGDFAAGTIVVRDNAAEIPALASLGTGDDDEAADVTGDDGLGREDRVLIEQYLARRANLDGSAAQAIATAIAARIRPKLRASFHYLDDVSLIEHIARSRG